MQQEQRQEALALRGRTNTSQGGTSASVRDVTGPRMSSLRPTHVYSCQAPFRAPRTHIVHSTGADLEGREAPDTQLLAAAQRQRPAALQDKPLLANAALLNAPGNVVCSTAP